MTYVVYGLDGSAEKFKRLAVGVDLNEDKDTVYVLGDLTVGEAPAELLCELSMRMNVYPIMGKTDYVAARMLAGFDKMLKNGSAPDVGYVEEMKSWVAGGGAAMLEGYRALDEDMKEGVLDYLTDFALYEETAVRGKSYFLLNAGISDFNAAADPEKYTPEHFITEKLDMNRGYFQDRFMVTGNALQGEYDKITTRGNNICLGCGRCACLRLEDGAEYYI